MSSLYYTWIVNGLDSSSEETKGRSFLPNGVIFDTEREHLEEWKDFWTPRRQTRGEESLTCSNDLFNFHKRYINLLGKLPDSFVGILISEGVNVYLHPWGALLEEISRVNIPQRTEVPLSTAGVPALAVFPGGTISHIRLQPSSALPHLAEHPYSPFLWVTPIWFSALYFSSIFSSLSEYLMKCRGDYLYMTDRDQFPHGVLTEAKKLIDANQIH